MNDWLTRFVLLQEFYPHLFVFLAVAVKTSVIVLVAWGLAHGFRFRSAAGLCWIWRSALIGVLATVVFDFFPGGFQGFRPAITVALSSEQTRAVWQEATVLKLVRTGEEMREAIQEKTERNRAEAVPPWKSDEMAAPSGSEIRKLAGNVIEAVVPTIWWGIAAVLAILTVVRVIAGGLWVRGGSSAVAASVADLGRELAGTLGLRRCPPIRTSPRVHSPLILGLVRAGIYLPGGSVVWPENKLRTVLCHELAHARRGDVRWQFFGKLVGCLSWWNPLVSLAVRRATATAEEAADDLVVRQTSRSDDYAELLVELASDGPVGRPAAGLPMIDHRSLEKRIRALLRSNPWRGRVGRLVAMSVVGLTLFSVGGASLYLARAENESTPPKSDLTPTSAERRGDLERIIERNERRLTEWRFLHFKLESTFSEETDGVVETPPQPTVLEAWVDGWTGIHRAEYRPRVTKWINGAAPFYIRDETEINDGRRMVSFETPDDLRDRDPRGLEFYLGISQTLDLIRLAETALRGGAGPKRGFQDLGRRGNARRQGVGSDS